MDATARTDQVAVIEGNEVSPASPQVSRGPCANSEVGVSTSPFGVVVYGEVSPVSGVVTTSRPRLGVKDLRSVRGLVEVATQIPPIARR